RERALELQNALSPLRNLVDVATFPVVLKEGLRMAGVEAGYCFAPARELAPEFRPALEKAVEAVTNI
ncbi:dihydrodipicolinate synthase family protein, partial [Pauljensenia sp. UMB3104]|nr:dihydrodipicolinate synthase family protein [Pauljensenia sp. UMB3104]